MLKQYLAKIIERQDLTEAEAEEAMKNVAGPRKELGVRTVFNILGPLTNPANAPAQLLGVFKKELAEVMAKVLLKLGIDRAVIVHGSDGLDEITISGPTFVTELSSGAIINYEISPEQFGIKVGGLDEIKGGEKEENAEAIRSILKGDLKGAKRDIIILNSAVALYVAKMVNSIGEGVKLANEMIDSGAAYKKLEDFVEITNNI